MFWWCCCSEIILILGLELTLLSRLYHRFLLPERSLVDFSEVLSIRDLLFLTVVNSFVFLPKNFFDFVVKFVPSVAHVKNLEGVLDLHSSDLVFAFIVHQELN